LGISSGTLQTLRSSGSTGPVLNGPIPEKILKMLIYDEQNDIVRRLEQVKEKNV